MSANEAADKLDLYKVERKVLEKLEKKGWEFKAVKTGDKLNLASTNNPKYRDQYELLYKSPRMFVFNTIPTSHLTEDWLIRSEIWSMSIVAYNKLHDEIKDRVYQQLQQILTMDPTFNPNHITIDDICHPIRHTQHMNNERRIDIDL